MVDYVVYSEFQVASKDWYSALQVGCLCAKLNSDN